MDFGKAVRVARSIAGISQSELAQRSDLDPSLISLIESGKRQPSTATLTTLSNHLQLPVHVLTMLGAEAVDLRDISRAEFHTLAESIARAVLQHDGRDNADRRGRRSPKNRPNSVSQRPRP